MTTSIYNLYEAKTGLSELVDRASKGEEIVIAKYGRPLARLVPLATKTLPRVPGGWEEGGWVAPDFDEPLPDELLEAFEGGASDE